VAREAEIIVVGQVEEVKPTGLVEYWSGVALSTARVRYRAKEVLKGEAVEQTIEVTHYIVHNSLTADKERPRLSPTLFRKGNDLVLFLKVDHKKESTASASSDRAYISFNADCGAVLAGEDIVKKIRQITAVKRKQ
jgi:hypothetical protein